MNNERESYASLFYRLDYEGNTNERTCTLRIEDSDGNEIKSYYDLELNRLGAHAQAKSFIDGYLRGLELGKQIGANNLRHDLKRLLNVGATL